MADAMDMGGLLGIDPEKWAAIMAASGISPTDKADIRKQQALMAGFALLGGRKGQELDAISRAGMGAVAYGQRATNDLLQNKQQTLTNAAMLAKFQQAQQAQRAAEAREKQVAGIMSGTPTFDMSNGRGPTPENAATISAPNPSQQYQQLAALFASDPEAAKKYIDISRSLLPKYSATPHTVIGPDGKPMLVQTSETEMPRGLPYLPAIESKSEDIGGRLQYRNPLTNQITGGTDKTMTFADKDRAAQLKIAQAAEQRAAANAGGDEWVNDLERGIQVNKRTGESRPITSDGKPIGSKAPKNTDPQLQAQGYHERMTKASTVIDKAEKAGYTPSFGSAYAEGLGQLPVIGGTVGGIANWVGQGVNPNMGPYKQAQRDWVRAKLRKESGAVIGPKEEAEEIATYFPQPGDSKAVIEQKAAARKTAEKAMAVQARFSGDSGNDDPLGLR